jgi:CheY-like chemotaxis protein
METGMPSNVLIVDDDQELLLVLKEGLNKYADQFSVVLAGDGHVAVQKLEEMPISLVVADLKMPKMDGFSLLAYISENYPDVPVMIMTAYGTPRMEKLARESGALAYMEKPVMADDLANQIITSLNRQSEGGTLRGISTGMFLQLIEMDQKTCTLRVTEKQSGHQGVLFFRDGALLDARTGHFKAIDAAYRILSWDDVSLSIQDSCPVSKNTINRDPQAVLMEAMRLKDEGAGSSEDQAEETNDQAKQIKEEIIEESLAENGASQIDIIRGRLEANLGERAGLQDIYQESGLDDLVNAAHRLGTVFQAGPLKTAYIDRQGTEFLVLLPSNPTTVISVSSRSPREKLIGLFSS